MKEEIINYLADKEAVSLEAIYKLFPEEHKEKVRTTLQHLVKSGDIVRKERGLYRHK